MNNELGLAILVLLVAGFGLVAVPLSRYSVSAAFAFTAIGSILGGAGLGLVTDIGETSWVSLLVEITLALVLFGDASAVDVRKLVRDVGAVARLLAIGLPLTIIIGTALAMWILPGTSLGVALLIAATLAPTDGALGRAVVNDRAVPARIRRILNVESGLNDGIAAPVVSLAIALAIAEGIGSSAPVVEALMELAAAAVVGVGVGSIGGWLLIRADATGWTSPASRGIVVLAIALSAYLLAVSLGASGFVAVFVAGLAFGAGSRRKAETAVYFTEALGSLLSIVVWLVFGLLVVAEHVVGSFDAGIVLYAVLSLTLVRMIPVAIGLLGVHFRPVTVAFVGWFGPRGLASIVFALIGLEALDEAGVASGPLAAVVAWTVLLSVVLHGFSAKPLASAYGRLASRLSGDRPEWEGDEEPRARAPMSLSMHMTDRSSSD